MQDAFDIWCGKILHPIPKCDPACCLIRLSLTIKGRYAYFAIGVANRKRSKGGPLWIAYYSEQPTPVQIQGSRENNLTWRYLSKPSLVMFQDRLIAQGYLSFSNSSDIPYLSLAPHEFERLPPITKLRLAAKYK